MKVKILVENLREVVELGSRESVREMVREAVKNGIYKNFQLNLSIAYKDGKFLVGNFDYEETSANTEEEAVEKVQAFLATSINLLIDEAEAQALDYAKKLQEEEKVEENGKMIVVVRVNMRKENYYDAEKEFFFSYILCEEAYETLDVEEYVV